MNGGNEVNSKVLVANPSKMAGIVTTTTRLRLTINF